MESSVKTHTARITGPRQLQMGGDMLLLTSLGGREVACATLYSAISPGTELALYEGLTPVRPERKHSRSVGYCNLAFAGGFLGSLAGESSLDRAAFRRAMIYGSATGSYAVERFSVDRFRELTPLEVSRRVEEFREMTTFEHELERL